MTTPTLTLEQAYTNLRAARERDLAELARLRDERQRVVAALNVSTVSGKLRLRDDLRAVLGVDS